MDTEFSAVQRAVALTHLEPVLREFGIGLDAVLSGTGVSAADLGPDRFIPCFTFLEIFDRAAAMTGCEDIGLRLGLRQSYAELGPVGAIIRSAATLGEALADFAAVHFANCTGTAAYLHRAGDEVIWGYGIYDATHAASPYVHDAVLAVGRSFLRDLTAGAIRPQGYASMRPAPSDPAAWRCLSAPIRFRQDRTCMFLSRAAMSFPLPTADRVARDAALSAASSQLDLAPWGWAGRTRHAMRSLLLDGRSKLSEVANHLGTHPRTLQRALKREGTGFETIKDDARFAVARELLSLTSLPVGDIATTLDFASPSAFIHAFQRWSGTSPTPWRHAQNAGR